MDKEKFEILDDLDLFLKILPQKITKNIENAFEDLIEIVLDLGRPPVIIYSDRKKTLENEIVSELDISFVLEKLGNVGDDNRAGIEKTLHRISLIKNRVDKTIGLTCRVGRAVFGSIKIIEDFIGNGKSILIMGKPGIGKTTMLREIARLLADKENKRVVPDKNMGPLIKTQMTRCIHCTRCVRFATEVAGVPEIGAIGRGENMEITTYLEKSMESELSANVIDLCPVGALTSKPYAFEARPWELKKTESVDVMDAVGSNIRVDTYNWEVKRILPRLNNDINEEWISDKTRYSCDGLLKQRLDVPYIKKDNKLQKSSWDEAIELLVNKIKFCEPHEIGGHIGDLVNLENSLGFKKLFNALKVKDLEFREREFYINSTEKINYLFNSSIKGIEQSDLILLIGTNPRHEATMLNARIRKIFAQKRIPIFSIGDPGDLTYEYTKIGNKTDDLKDIINEQGEFYNKFSSAKKPIIIIGESALELKSGKFILEELKNFLIKKSLITKEWNALNFLPQNASTVGLIDLKILSKEQEKESSFFKKLRDNKFKLIYLLGSDNLELKKNQEFIIYQGSHGDKGAEIADLVLPSAAYTEQNGLYENLEGRVQECKKASYPIGEALEDWKIFNLIIKKTGMSHDLLNFEKLRKEVLNLIPNFTKLNDLPSFNESKLNQNKSDFFSEPIDIKEIDYFYSNSISRASKTMSECRQIKQNLKKTGTNNR